jgi:hypothetical protein
LDEKELRDYISRAQYNEKRRGEKRQGEKRQGEKRQGERVDPGVVAGVVVIAGELKKLNKNMENIFKLMMIREERDIKREKQDRKAAVVENAAASELLIGEGFEVLD